MLEGVNVTLDEQKIGTALHGQEATTRDIDTMSYGLGVSCLQWRWEGSHP